jgi:hypothetical protein
MRNCRRRHAGYSGNCGGGQAAFVQPACQPMHVVSQAMSSYPLAEAGMEGVYSKDAARVAISAGALKITGNPASGEAAAFRRATSAILHTGSGASTVDLASSDNVVSAGLEQRQQVVHVPVNCGWGRVGYQQQIVTTMVETQQVQSQSVIINRIPDSMGRLHLTLGSQDRAFVDLASIQTDCVISLDKKPGSAGKAVLILGDGRTIESLSFDRTKGTAVLKVGGQEVSITGISSPEDLLVATSVLDARQGVLADIGAVSSAVMGRGIGAPQAEAPNPTPPPVATAPEPSPTPSLPSDPIIAEKDKDKEIADLKAQMEEMRQEMEKMRKLMEDRTPPGTAPGELTVPSNPPSGPRPYVEPSIDYAQRAGALHEQLKGWSLGVLEMGLSAQLKVMHQFSDLTDEQARKLKDEYQRIYAPNLIADIEKRLSVGRAAALKAKLVGFNSEELAKQMQSNIDAWVDDEPAMLVDLISNLSFGRRKAVSVAFKQLTGQSVLEALKADYAWNDNVTPIEPFLNEKDIPGLTEAAELYHLMNGSGSNDEPLILRTLERGAASPGELAGVFGAYFAKTWSKKTLLEVLQQELSEESFKKAKAVIERSDTEV